MAKRLAEILKTDFERYYRKSLFTDGGRTATLQPSLFDLFGNPLEETKKRGRRPYTDKVQPWMKDGAMVLFEGQLGTLSMRRSSRYSDTAVDFQPMPDNNAYTERANDYLPIRETYFELTIKEREDKKAHPELRDELNSRYGTFTRKWGFFHDNDNKNFILLDSLGVEVFTIETQTGKDIGKADIMREPVAFKRIDSEKELAPMEALASSLNFYGMVDFAYIAQATGKSWENCTSELKGEIFFNPISCAWEHKGKFIAGNVIAKRKDIEESLRDLDGEGRTWAEQSLKALEEATPEAIPYEELDINMGERWIDARIYTAYDDSDRIQDEAYNDLRPAVANLPDAATIARYDTIFVGSPCWWHQPAMVVCTFLEAYDLTCGKKIMKNRF